jgi:hypothetical protein
MSTDHPCPYCQANAANKVRFTPWGGIIGPRILSLVQCIGCGKHFNGKSGSRVEKAIRIYTTVSLALLALLVAFIIHAFSGDKTAAPSRHAPGPVAQLIALNAPVTRV